MIRHGVSGAGRNSVIAAAMSDPRPAAFKSAVGVRRLSQVA